MSPPPGSDRPDTIEACCTRHNVQIGNWKKNFQQFHTKQPQLYLIFICKTKQSSDILRRQQKFEKNLPILFDVG